MRYLSVCSGIEAATCAFEPLGFQPVAFSEIEKFPSAVLAHHYPDVPNLGDMTKYKEWDNALGHAESGGSASCIDLLVGGTPCQSFSVAGLRKGLDDPRGNLALVYLGITERFQPRWILWENVPGVLSSWSGPNPPSDLPEGSEWESDETSDFGCFLEGLSELGYGWAYRILDAQYFGVPQRRRRVFVVGYLGDWRRAAAVLFERHSLQGHTPPSREKGESPIYSTSPSLTASGRGTERTGESRGQDCVIPVHTTGAGFWQEGLGTLRAREQDSHENLLCMAHGQGNAEICRDGSPSLTCNHEAPIVMSFNANARPDEMKFEEVNAGLTCSQNAAVAFAQNQVGEVGRPANGQAQSVHGGMQVRRLTPECCEFLQGFPRGYTNIPWGKKECPDGPRYKALGNSMCTNVMRWIGERIKEVDAL